MDSTTATTTTRPTGTPTAVSASQTLDSFFGVWRRLIPSEGVSLTAASTLRLLSRSGPVRLTALAEGEAVSQPAMTGLVSRLQSAGLVIRRPDPSDGRAVLVELTSAGLSLIEDRRARRTVAMDGLLDLLDLGERARLDAAIPVLQRLIDESAREQQHEPDVEERR